MDQIDHVTHAFRELTLSPPTFEARLLNITLLGYFVRDSYILNTTSVLSIKSIH